MPNFLLRIWQFIKTFITLIRRTIRAYQRDAVGKMGAALAYYTIFSLPAILIIVISILGAMFGKSAVEGEIYTQIKTFFSNDIALQIQSAVKAIAEPKTNKWAALFGSIILIFGASGVFYALQDALHTIYGVYSAEKRKGWLQMIINRLMSIGMVICIGFLLLTSLVLNALLSALADFTSRNQVWIQEKVSEGFSFLSPLLDYFTGHFFVWLNVGITFGFIVLFFALIYKVLPDAYIKWRYIWRGSFFTALLFWGGKSLMGLYIAHTNFTNAYGAAGSVVAILIWVYFSSQLIFFGAEFIKILSQHEGVPVTPRAYGDRITGSSIVLGAKNTLVDWFKRLWNKLSGKKAPIPVPKPQEEQPNEDSGNV